MDFGFHLLGSLYKVVTSQSDTRVDDLSYFLFTGKSLTFHMKNRQIDERQRRRPVIAQALGRQYLLILFFLNLKMALLNKTMEVLSHNFHVNKLNFFPF